MTKKLRFELSPEAVDTLHKLMKPFGETEPAQMISRLISLGDVIREYLNSDGTLTVVDPTTTGLEVCEADLVDLIVADVDYAPVAHRDVAAKARTQHHPG